MSDWLDALRQCGERGLDAVVVTVLAGKGSTPREAGAKMVVAPDSAHGTIGGGALEFQAIDIARDLLRAEGKRAARRFPLGASLGQICGGAANLWFERVAPGASWVRWLAERLSAGTPSVLATPAEGAADGRLLVSPSETAGGLGDAQRDAEALPLARALLERGNGPQLARLADGTALVLEVVRPPDFDIVLFGAGHVGRSLAKVLGTLPCSVTWVDGRRGEFPAQVPGNVQVVVSDQPLGAVAGARPGSHFLVLTHSHALDFELVEAVLARGDFAYCGMIGSATKRRSFENGLAERGVAPALLARLTCPIGIGSLKSKAPSTIAIAVAAQLLELRERGASIGSEPGGGEWTRSEPRRA